MERNTILLAGTVLMTAAFGATITADNNLVVHEWGTFTSVAGETGEPIAWAPLVETPDLPCFVNRLSPQNPKAANALVRMETPVLYFYPQHDMTVAVHVGFPQGWITEWYPHATEVQPKPFTNPTFLEYRNGQISWNEIHLTPGKDERYPMGKGASRYYAARQTDSAPLTIAGQQEKMIFYRGIGNFAIPLRASFDGQGMLNVRNTGAEPVPMAMLFENRDGRVGYRMVSNSTNPPELTSSMEEVKRSLRDALVKHGLFPKEASAMIATWQDSWFEEGSRLIYIVPRQMVDRVLPLNVSPVASTVERVFVGRIEILSPAVRASMETDLALGKTEKLDQLGRFLEPFVAQIQHVNPGLMQSPAAQETLQKARNKFWQNLEVTCVP